MPPDPLGAVGLLFWDAEINKKQLTSLDTALAINNLDASHLEVVACLT